MSTLDGIPSSTPEATLQKYADRVTRRWRGRERVVFATGEELIRIKAKLPHGDFERIFQDHPHAIAHPVPFGIRAAQTFMETAADPVLSNVAQQRAAREEDTRLHRDLALQLLDIGYKALATRLHPDRGGANDGMRRLNRVREDLTDVAQTRRFI